MTFKRLFVISILLLSFNAYAVDTPESITDSSASSGLGGLADKLGLGGFGESNEPLPPDEAFKFFVTTEGGQIKAKWMVTPGHYLYREKTKFKLESPETASLGDAVFPASKTKNDEYLGKTEVYEKDFEVSVPVISKGGEITVQTTYQGCSETTGICYPPQRKTHTLTVAALDAAAATLPEDVKVQSPDTDKASSAAAKQTATSTSEPAQSEQDMILDKIKGNSTLGTVFMFLLAGLGLALTPCVFPMIPILSGIIAGQGKSITTKKAFLLSIAYVIPMALIYAVVGVIAGLGGANLQIVFQNPWVISSFAFLFVLLSLSMFGFYELQMPASIQSKLNDISNKQESGSYIGAAIMGVLSALIVGPCVTAPLIAALTYIAQTGDAALGGLSLFALGIGMGIPLILIGTSAGKLLPKAGAWMEATKAVFGVLMLALAIWMLDRILPFQAIMALSAVLLIISAIYLKAISHIPDTASKWAYMWKGLGLIMLIYGTLILVGLAGGSKSILHPLKGIVSASGAGTAIAQQQGLIFKRVRNIAEFNDVIAQAKQNDSSVMLDFYADWCVSCKEMEHTTFMDQGVVDALKKTILIQADVTENNDDDKALLKKFGLFGPPGILFFKPDGQELLDYRVVGEMGSAEFREHVNKALTVISG